ncbi:MAG: hypothetical protein ABWY12_04710 [Burkholderiales bacterium]
MTLLARWTSAIACVCLTTAALDAGGWAVITVVRTPDTVVAGEPVTVTYAARQHGQTLLNGLQGQIEARLGETVIHATATALSENGHYAATLTLPRAGTWTLDIESGFHGSAGRTAIRAIEPGSSVPALSREVRGQRLFESKGCVRCHLESWSSAPRVNPSGYETGHLTRFLTSPPTATGNEWRMPNLGLTGDEVASLVAFINRLRPAENAVVVEPTTCKVTRANGQGTFLEGMSPDLHGNALISTALWPDGTVVFRPGGPGFVATDGALSMKWGWYRGVRGRLRIEGRRLDEPAAPLRAEIPAGYGDFGFQSSALIFPTPGCWEVTGHVGTASLTFVTLVHRIGEGPLTRAAATR